ncbi:hypothetical protein O3M35_002030 [Rhynocoris fuscipes]|uniref:Uncharacterized protein n=1 Tax=Rhynocoris fuscipes TaxID=488301 RepID=A0AAW1CPK9_9HEMI
MSTLDLDYQTYFYITIIKTARMVLPSFCTFLWLLEENHLNYFIVYYIWPIDAVICTTILIHRINQYRFELYERLRFETIDIAVDIFGYIGSLTAGLAAYLEFNSGTVNCELWVSSFVSAALHLLDFWLVLDYATNSQNSCAGWYRQLNLNSFISKIPHYGLKLKICTRYSA